jgi:hypothetical protein
MRLGGRGSKSPGWGDFGPGHGLDFGSKAAQCVPFAREYADLPAPPTTFD